MGSSPSWDGQEGHAGHQNGCIKADEAPEARWTILVLPGLTAFLTGIAAHYSFFKASAPRVILLHKSSQLVIRKTRNPSQHTWMKGKFGNRTAQRGPYQKGNKDSPKYGYVFEHLDPNSHLGNTLRLGVRTRGRAPGQSQRSPAASAGIQLATSCSGG